MRQCFLSFILFIGLSFFSYAQTPVDTTIYLLETKVTGTYPARIHDGEIKGLSIEKNPAYIAATVAEALRSIPSLVSDIEGGILYRGSSRPGFLINGIPYGFLEEYNGDMLIQLPTLFFNHLYVSSFPSIHLIPDGEAGSINFSSISPFSNQSPLQVNLGAGWHERYNAGVILNHQQGPFSIQAKYNYRKEYRERTFRKTTTTSTGTTEMNNSASARPDTHLADLTLGYDISSKNKITAYGLYYRMDYDRYGKIMNTRTNPAGEVVNHIYRHRNNVQYQDAYAVETRWEHLFNRPNEKLNVIFNYNNFSYDEENRYQNENPQTGAILVEDDLFINHEKHNFYFSGDWSKSLYNGWSFSGGYTGRIRKENYVASAHDKSGEEWIINPNKSNRYEFERQLHLIYASVKKDFGGFHAEAGLQGEINHQVTRPGNENVTVNRFHLYPRFQINYQIKENSRLTAGYQQRVIRPTGAALNPFIDTSDATYIFQGNPELKDEYIHSVDVAYLLHQKNWHITPALYFRNRNNRIMDIVQEAGDQTIWRKENIGHSCITGMEIAITWNPIQTLSIGFSGNIYRDQIDGRTIGYDEKKTMTCGDIKGSIFWAFTPTTEFQADAFYISDQLTPQGKIKSRSSVNAGITQIILRDKLKAVISIQDIFNTLGETTLIDTNEMQMKQERLRDARVGWVSLFYTL